MKRYNKIKVAVCKMQTASMIAASVGFGDGTTTDNNARAGHSLYTIDDEYIDDNEDVDILDLI